MTTPVHPLRIGYKKGFRSIMQTYFILLCLVFMSLFWFAMKDDQDDYMFGCLDA